MVDAIHYFPFGEVWLEEVPASLPVDYFFTAKELDQETGFYDFGARYLDPRFSKWMTADPALGSYLSGSGAFSPANLALYGYGRQNPATFWDPDGAQSVCTSWNPTGAQFASSRDPVFEDQNRASFNRQQFTYAIGGPIIIAVMEATKRIFGASPEVMEAAGEATFTAMAGVRLGGVRTVGPPGRWSPSMEFTPAGSPTAMGTSRAEIVQLLRLRSRQLELGQEPGGRINELEGAGAVRVEQFTGRTMSRSPDPAWDLNDSLLGRIQLKGPLERGREAQDFPGFVKSVVKDLQFSSSAQTLVVNVRGLSEAQILQLQQKISETTQIVPKRVILIK